MTDQTYQGVYNDEFERLPLAANRDAFGYLKRSYLIVLLFLIPAFLCGMSWMSGGMPAITDLGFLALTIIGIGLLAREFMCFPSRFGIGGIVLFGGYVIWFCYDYLTIWWGRDFNTGPNPYSRDTIARASFFYTIFLGCATLGLLLPWGERLVRSFQKLPEPIVPRFYLVLVLICFVIGLLPYFLFTSESGFDAILGMITGGRTGSVRWMVGRSGAVNTNWGAYIVQLMQVGQVGALLAAFCAILIFRNILARLICWVVWVVPTLIAFGTGTRGEFAFMVLPVIALLFIKYQARAVERFKRHSVWAYVLSATIGFLLLFFIQVQGAFRTVGFTDVDYSQVNTFDLKGNAMFSEGLVGWQVVPEFRDYYYNDFPGETIIAPIPVTIWNFILGPIPRALWPEKPLDPLQPWYNSAFRGLTKESYEGVNITPGLVTDWYCRYGPAGVIQGGLIFGLLCRIAEEGFRRSGGRPLQLILSLGLAVFAFRTFRSFTFIILYPLLIGVFVMAVLIKITNVLQRGSGAAPEPTE